MLEGRGIPEMKELKTTENYPCITLCIAFANKTGTRRLANPLVPLQKQGQVSWNAKAGRNLWETGLKVFLFALETLYKLALWTGAPKVPQANNIVLCPT